MQYVEICARDACDCTTVEQSHASFSQVSRPDTTSTLLQYAALPGQLCIGQTYILKFYDICKVFLYKTFPVHTMKWSNMNFSLQRIYIDYSCNINIQSDIVTYVHFG